MPENNPKSFNCGDTVFIMKDNKATQCAVVAKNVMDRFVNKEVQTKIEYFVEGFEREVSIDEMHKTREELLKTV